MVHFESCKIIIERNMLCFKSQYKLPSNYCGVIVSLFLWTHTDTWRHTHTAKKYKHQILFLKKNYMWVHFMMWFECIYHLGIVWNEWDLEYHSNEQKWSWQGDLLSSRRALYPPQAFKSHMYKPIKCSSTFSHRICYFTFFKAYSWVGRRNA